MEKKAFNFDSKKVLIIIFIIACLIRVLFISFSKIESFQYDVGVGNLHLENAYERVFKRDKEVMRENRHADYILKIYETGKLPETNKVQQYHPPLYHIISAIWLKAMDVFDFLAETRLESLQIPTCIYSILTLFIIWKILDELEIENRIKIITMSVCSFHPIFVYMSGLINNDTMLTMFSILSILYIIKWYKNQTYKNTIWLAIIIGLGTLIKSSMLVNLTITAIVVFIKFLEILYEENYKKVKEIFLQSLVFILISLPLILIFPIRNYILFEQAPFAVHDAAEELYVGNDDLISRFGIFNKEILNNTLGYKDQNILSYVIKSAIVFETNREDVIGTTFVKVLSIILIVTTLISMIWLLFSKDRKNLILIISYLVWIVFFISFNYQMPNSCTMHSRYIITGIVISIICLTKLVEEKKNKKMEIATISFSLLYSITSLLLVLLNIF